ncbi:hypothetical protein ACLKMY_21130 [Paraburkholderia mimosarum]|uniref:hypothetical protein n=1 Tax=Paraburkholderia mimosarum TaxID=312026 RepID=UPI0039C01B76
MSRFQAVGAWCFGAVVGWLASFAVEYTARVSVGWLAGMVAAIGGGAVVKLYGAAPSLFASYAIGLFIVFAIRNAYISWNRNPSETRGGEWQVIDTGSGRNVVMYEGTKKACEAWVRRQKTLPSERDGKLDAYRGRCA